MSVVFYGVLFCFFVFSGGVVFLLQMCHDFSTYSRINITTLNNCLCLIFNLLKKELLGMELLH